ncbi:MAG: arsenate reductase (glutaredoxin) [Gammaproteobacteria bacterium]
MSVVIYHNSRCSKSRQTLALLEEKGIEPEIIEYLKTPPDAEAVRMLVYMLDISPRDLMRKGEKVYKENNLSDESLSADDLINAMVENPILIERPIVISNGKAAIGRPPESVLEIL